MAPSLYTFSSQTLTDLQKFRFASARATSMQAVIYAIDKEAYSIVKETEHPVTSLEDLVEELPDNSPRYVVLSYPMKLQDGRIKSPLVLIYWRPPTCGQESKMLYAGAVELMREKAGVSQYVFNLPMYSNLSILLMVISLWHKFWSWHLCSPLLTTG